VIIILAHEAVGDLEIIYVAEDDGTTITIGSLALDEGEGLVAPVTERI
jgi:hypothetical protein